jgi:hypothetical protein
MKITRRKFLKSGSSSAALAAGAVLFPQIGVGQTGPKDPELGAAGHLGGWDPFNAISGFSKDDFEAQVGTEFELLSKIYGHRTASLVSVRQTSKSKGERTEGFSLLFKGRDWQDVDQDVYYVSHPTLGYFHVLMSPVRESRTSSALLYEVVVNRLM